MYREIAMLNDSRDRPISAATLRRIHATLMSALNTAVKRGLIDRNPASTVELPRAAKPTTTAWTAEELARFLDAISDDRLHTLYLVLGLVGLRRGEAVALRWDDLDLNRGLLRVQRSAVRTGKVLIEGPPKSASGSRTVAIDDETCRRLHWHGCRQRLEVLRATGLATSPTLVFTTPQGTQLDPTYVSRHFDRLVAKQELPRIRLHDLRHTSASIGLASGESLVEVSRRLGHSSITVTADVYSHVAPVVAKESAERLARQVYRSAAVSGEEQ
ncbi:tyrosine-type recombinase/integrase [Nocardioides taihuensis]|uniref:Tyrosine-type recombinase/integrase n=1 Tax=Nocardioides taihuensis TaxID=1835606 RepID=A0ABW0BPS1_9ACTN